MNEQHLIDLALRRHLLSPAQIDQAKREQQQLAQHGVRRSLWFTVVELGFIDRHQDRDLRCTVSSGQLGGVEIEGFRLEQRLGSGGMGDVFLARSPSGQQAAVKLLAARHGETMEYCRRFSREARATLRLTHPHIVRSLNAGEIEDQRYLLMEYVPGQSLKEYIKEHQRLAPRESLILLAQMAQALAYAWSNGVLHRDVKPANIILAPGRTSAEPFCAKLCDFGLAKLWHEGVDESRTYNRVGPDGRGMALGTPHYMSPEQALGEQNLDQRSDIYGLGATVYHAMLGRTLHDGKSSTAIMYQQVTEQLDLKPLVEAGITPPLVRLLGGMLEKERARRFSDWSAVLTVLREIDPSLAPAPAPGSVSDPALCGVGSASDRRRRQPVRALIATALLGAALTAGLAGGLYLLIGGAGHNHLTPETFAASVAAGHQGPVTLVPGDYGPVALGSAQSGLVISAAAPGVIFHGDRRAPALRLLAGATAIELHGIDFVADGGDAVHAEAGARARLVDCRVSGACERLLAAQGARLHCSGLTGRGRIEVDGGEVTFDGCSLAAPAPVIALRGATVLLGRTRVSGSGDGSVVTCSAADLVCDAVIIDGPSAACGLDLAGGTCTLRDLSITARGLGLRCAEATVSSIDGLTVNAGEVALAWSGPFPTGWRWFNLDLRAPQRHQGLSEVAESVVAGAGIGGARVQRLRQIPIDTP